MTLEKELLARIEALLHAIATDERPCRRCGAHLAFVRHANGRTAPYTLDGVNHFANCPNATEFRAPNAAAIAPPPPPPQAWLFEPPSKLMEED